MKNVVLPNVTLAAIVRDEIINPAGGIVDFLHCTLPFVSEAVIVDTGSVDGTREILEDVKKTYSNLRVFDHEFTGFANARNYSLNNVKTSHVLVLDADERLCEEDFVNLKEEIASSDLIEGLKLRLTNVTEDGLVVISYLGIHNPRLFKNFISARYNDSFGVLESLKPHGVTLNSKISIKHFLPTNEAMACKRDWYDKVTSECATGEKYIGSPSKLNRFREWKELNPFRRNYHFGLPDYQFKVQEDSCGRK